MLCFALLCFALLCLACSSYSEADACILSLWCGIQPHMSACSPLPHATTCVRCSFATAAPAAAAAGTYAAARPPATTADSFQTARQAGRSLAPTGAPGYEEVGLSLQPDSYVKHEIQGPVTARQAGRSLAAAAAPGHEQLECSWQLCCTTGHLPLPAAGWAAMPAHPDHPKPQACRAELPVSSSSGA